MPLPPPSLDLDRIVADVHWLVEEVGPRYTGSKADHDAWVGIESRLKRFNWEPIHVGLTGNLVACRGDGQTLLLAHHDTVHDSPGAVDNAAGVAILLEIARITEAQNLCLGFPTGEEIGLIGSKAMADSLGVDSLGNVGKQGASNTRAVDSASDNFTYKWPVPAPKLVVALDLVGHGKLAINGLGQFWGDSELQWLLDTVALSNAGSSSQSGSHTQTAPIDIPLTYRTISKAFPAMERSDHGPFSEAGVLSMHLLGRNENGIFPNYHTKDDITVEPEALIETVQVLQSIVNGPPPPTTKTSGPAFAFMGALVPSGLVWAIIGTGIASGLADIRKVSSMLSILWRAVAAIFITAGVMAGISASGWFDSSPPEKTAKLLLGTPDTGWWNGATFALAAGCIAWLMLRHWWKPKGSGALLASFMSLSLLIIDPLLAAPMALSALLCRIHPLLAMLPAALLLRPDALRELAFHGLLSPAWWGVLWLLAAPSMGSGGIIMTFKNSKATK